MQVIRPPRSVRCAGTFRIDTPLSARCINFTTVPNNADPLELPILIRVVTDLFGIAKDVLCSVARLPC